MQLHSLRVSALSFVSLMLLASFQYKFLGGEVDEKTGYDGVRRYCARRWGLVADALTVEMKIAVP